MSSAAVTTRRDRTRDKSAMLYLTGDGEIKRISHQSITDPIQDVSEEKVAYLGASPEFSHSLPELPIPATGEAYDDCGEEQPLQFCKRCGQPRTVPRSCRRSVCPECWESGVKRQAVPMAAKIEGRLRYEAMKYKNMHGETWGSKGLKQHHLSIDPPKGFWTRSENPLEYGKEICKVLLGEVGADEGAIIYHPWRIAEEHRGEVLGHESGEGDMTWKDLYPIIEEKGWKPVREEYLVFSPHFHAIVLSRYITGTEHVHDRSGWLIHRITKGEDSNVSIGNKFDLAKVAGYTLSHAGQRETDAGHKEAQYWYFGETHGFDVSPGVRQDMENVFNSVSDTILGVAFGNGRCSEDPEGVTNGAGAEVEIEVVDLPSDYDPTEECGGKYEQMQHAEEYLEDEEWCEGAPYVDELRVAHTEFQAIEATTEERDRPPD